MNGKEFKECCEVTEVLMTMTCVDGPHGNMTISFIGVPREWSVFVACADGRDLTGKGPRLLDAFGDLLQQYQNL